MACFAEKKTRIEHKMDALISSTNSVCNISHSKDLEPYMYLGIHIKYALLLSPVNETDLPLKCFEES
jgi:hypothetical protein